MGRSRIVEHCGSVVTNKGPHALRGYALCSVVDSAKENSRKIPKTLGYFKKK